MSKGRVAVNGDSDLPAAEAALLAALAGVPSLVFPFGQNPFEPHKAALLWATAAIAAAAALPLADRRTFAHRPWTTRYTLSAGVFIAAALVSWALAPSNARALAWWGSGLRRFGAFTEIALAGCSVLTAILGARPESFRRLVTAGVLGSIAPTLYGLSQWLGVDPLLAGTPLWERPGGTFGNPLWLSGYLAAVLPVTAAFAATATAAWQRRAAATLAVLQIVVIAAARSRGPVVALTAAALVGGALLFASRGRRRFAVASALAAVIAAGAVVVAVPLLAPAGALESNNSATHNDRGRETVSIRLLLWRAAGAGLGTRPVTRLFGTGPESMPRALTSYAGPSARTLEGPEEVPDRAHNDSLDRVVMFGWAGLAARAALLVIALAAALSALGLVRRGVEMRFAGFAAAVAMTMIVAGGLLGGAWTLALAVPAALVAMPCAWVIIRGSTGASDDGTGTVWVAAATASWFAHTIDVHTSIASVASALAGAAALGLVVAGADGSASAFRAAARERGGSTDYALALVAGLVSILTLTALTPDTGASAVSWFITAATLVVALLITGGGLGAAATAIALVLTFAVFWLPTSDLAGAADLHARGAMVRTTLLSGVVFVTIAFVTWRLAGARRGGWSAASLAAGAVAAAVVGVAAVHTSQLDAVLAVAAACEDHGDFTCAQTEYQRALAIDPSDPRTLTRLGRTLMRQADSARSAGTREELFDVAAASFARASQLDPYDYHHPRNLGALARRRARQTSASDRPRQLARADDAYAEAIARAPLNPSLWLERANLELEERRPDAALRTLEQAAALGANQGTTLLVGDAVLTAIDVDVSGTAAFERAAAALRARGLERLAALYAARGGRDGDR